VSDNTVEIIANVTTLAPVAENNPLHSPAQSTATETAPADSWHVVVLNDPVNLMSYVVMVFKKVLGFDETRARKHMLEVHEQGRSLVWSGHREQAEAYVFSLQQWHLTAVLESHETR
jgi:ATP-dependent Clp protease adaptor protein ClpS